MHRFAVFHRVFMGLIARQPQLRPPLLSEPYSWVTMQDNDFLLPARGAVSLQEARMHPVLNEFEFLGYRRFGSQSRVLSDNEVKSTVKK